MDGVLLPSPSLYLLSSWDRSLLIPTGNILLQQRHLHAARQLCITTYRALFASLTTTLSGLFSHVMYAACSPQSKRSPSSAKRRSNAWTILAITILISASASFKPMHWCLPTLKGWKLAMSSCSVRWEGRKRSGRKVLGRWKLYAWRLPENWL